MLRVRNVSKSFVGPSGRIQALHDFSLDLSARDFVALQGPSGSGKTTLLLMAGGMLKPDEGSVLVSGVDLYALGAEERARHRAKHLGFVFQQFHLIPYLTIVENVLAASVALNEPHLEERADALLQRFGLMTRRHHLPGQLSSGERQRTALARALLHRPGLLLADEPTGNLDAENGQIVLDALAAYVDDGGAVLLVTHDPRAAERAQRVIPLAKLS